MYNFLKQTIFPANDHASINDCLNSDLVKWRAKHVIYQFSRHFENAIKLYEFQISSPKLLLVVDFFMKLETLKHDLVQGISTRRDN